MAGTPPVCDFGWKAPDFSLLDTEGAHWDLARLAGPKGLVLVFICNHCPYVKAVADKLAREGRELAGLGIGTAAICSNDAATYPEDGFEQMGAFARAHDFPFPYLHDADQTVAKAYGAVCTPDFFGFNAEFELQYRGRLDASGTRNLPDAERELYAAMARVAETGQGPRAQTPSMGCSIKWKAA